LRKPLLAILLVISIVASGIVAAVVYTGLGTPIEQPFLLNGGDNICKIDGTYCHLFRITNGTMNISFPSVDGGTFNYSVEG
jgi:hypothetical protein